MTKSLWYFLFCWLVVRCLFFLCPFSHLFQCQESLKILLSRWFQFWYVLYCQSISSHQFEEPLHFYTPVWKTGRIMPWQCPSVRPSVRPRFPDFSSTCFEISIWNLVYTFSRCHNMSSLSCIIIGSLWPSLQPKVGQTFFLQSWPHKSR